MAITLSSLLAQFMMDNGLNSAFDTTGVLEFRDGTRPATADTTPSGTNLLASFALPAKVFASPSTLGVMNNANPFSTAAAALNGTATWFRFKLSTDTGTTGTVDRRLDGNLGSSGADINMSSTTIIAGLPVTVTSVQITTPKS